MPFNMFIRRPDIVDVIENPAKARRREEKRVQPRTCRRISSPKREIDRVKFGPSGRMSYNTYISRDFPRIIQSGNFSSTVLNVIDVPQYVRQTSAARL